MSALAEHRRAVARTVTMVIVVAAVLVAVPYALPNDYWVDRVAGWIPLAVAALGLNLLTGYNGQISLGHGALYGTGAYATALILNHLGWPYLLAVVGSAVVCFVAGVLVGLPALRIKGLYLALVTLAVAVLFPQILEQFSSVTGGSAGLGITESALNHRGVVVEQSIRFDPPEGSGLSTAQWRYFFMVAVAVVCFVITRNIIHSRTGRAIVAIRDNETAAEVSGVDVARTKVLTFGVSASLAGVAGALFALFQATQPSRISSGSFTLLVSLYFLVAIVIGGPQSIIGPALGAIAIGVFRDVITPELPERVKTATPLILGALLIVSVLAAPGGIVGTVESVRARRRRSPATITPTPTTEEP
ncbi:MAG: branched-chain amino acid ABC transporter permease [Microthrixaceae bacterium]